MTGAPRILGIGTASPQGQLTPDSSLELARRLCPEGDPERLDALYRSAGVSERGCVLLGPQGEQELFTLDAGSGPSTATRLARYRSAARQLAGAASLRTLHAAERDPASVTHIVTVSCTGAQSPGVDHDLIEDLGLSPDISRTHIGFMGCHGAINGLAVAASIVRADPDALVLLACVELCSLHFHVGGTWDQQVANAIFADGAACALVGMRQSDGPELRGFASRVFPGTRALMSWEIGDHGFEMHLSPRVPGVLRRAVGGWVDGFLAPHGIDRDAIAGWAIHPGGRDILEGVRIGLGLGEPSLAPSRRILDRHGNMSSGTVLWVLDDMLRAGARGPVVAMSFGPGLSGEAAILHTDG
ncbi:MAG: type III polyketide synthase [Phycisphaerales bacterium]|nr:type III polyketide synthase [Phycisphaerales bacterium]